MNHSLIEPLEARIAPASLTLSPPSSFQEGNNDHLVVFTVTLDQPAQTPVTVQYATADGAQDNPLNNATVADGDYDETHGTLTFPAGSLTQTFTVNVHGDTKYELPEGFTATISNPVGATIAIPTATATIQNDDIQPTISITPATVVEGNDPAHPTHLDFIVSLSNTTSDTIVVTASTSDGTATLADHDYTATTTVLTFAPGETSKTFSVPVTPDTKSENDETILANLNVTSGSVLPGPLQATGTIQTDDPRITIDDAQIVEGAAGTTPSMVFHVTVDSVLPNQVVSVHYATADGTAVSTGTIAAGTLDYQPTNGTLVLTADGNGHMTGTIAVPVNGDGVVEGNETFTLNLSNATVLNADTTTTPIGITKTAGTGTIINDDPSLTITGGTVTESDLHDNTKIITFTVTASALTPGQQVSVNFATMDGTAVSTGTVQAGTFDYLPTSGVLDLPQADANGNATKTFTVQVNGDGVMENTESFSVVLSNPTLPIPFINSTAQGTITDNDTHVLTINDVSVVEGDAGQKNAVFVVSLTPGATSAVTVHYMTVDGTATSGSTLPDFTGQTDHTLTFTPGTTTQTIIVPILGDLVHEGTENFTVVLSNATGASIANDIGTGTIIDNGDPIPTISLTPVSVVEGNGTDANHLTFTATLSAPSQDTVMVDYVTADGTATTADHDYTAAAATLIFAPGKLTQTFTIDVTADATNEGNETMSVNLSNPSNATLATGHATATGTILNDDITASIAPVTFTEGDTGTFMTVTLSAAPVAGSTAVVNFVLNSGSAVLNSDFKLHDPTMTSVTFNAGETTKTIPIDIIDDSISEGIEAFTVTLTGATGAAIDSDPTHSTVQGTIHDNDPLPTVSIANAQVTEGDTGTKSMAFTVTLSAASGQTISVNAATLDGSAHANTDYTALSMDDPDHPGQTLAFKTLTFNPGETTKTFLVPIIGDTVDEQTENFQIQLSSPVNVTLATGHDVATGTILDNDLRVVSISDASVAEGASGDHNHLTFTVSIPNAATQDITVHYDTFDGTAKAGTDYNAQTGGTVTIPHGATTATFTVDVIGNDTAQPNRALVVKLRDPLNATLGDAQGVGTIVDDEASYKLVPVTATNVEDDGTTTAKTVTYQVVRSGDAAALAIPGSVTFTTVDGTGPNGAVAGSDYIAQNGTLNFAPGETVKTITVALRKDFAHENTETFQIELTGSSSGVLKDDTGVQTALFATATITDNDPLPTISISSPTVTEGNPGDSGETDLTFVVSLSAADQTHDVTVSYMTVDGTGEDGAISVTDGTRPADFTGIGPTTLTIPAGALSASFVVHVTRDTINEGDETFSVKLSDPTGGEAFAPGGDTGTGTIKNDDAGPTITFAGANGGNLSLVEGNVGDSTPASFTVQLSAASEQTVTVDVGLGAGTAKLGTDFTNTNVPSTLSFAPGETSKTITYSIVGDATNEADETFAVVLSNAKHATLNSSAPVEATATIKNDDAVPTLAIGSVSAPEGNSGTTDFIFTVSLTGSSDLPVTVDYATSDAAASSSGPSPDYQAVHGTLTFAPGETTKTISVPVNGDTIKEINESFNVNLSNVSSNATITAGLASGTILDDGDSIIGVSVFDSKVAEGDSGTKNATFNVQLSAPANGTVTVDLATRNGTAVAGSDYTAQKVTLTFAAGQVFQSVTVPIIGDGVFEATESYFLDATNATGGAQILGGGEGRGTIYNDDLQIVNAQTVRYVDADGDLATVHISKGPLTTTGSRPVLNFTDPNSIGGRTLEMIDFTSNRIVYNHTDVSVTAGLQPGFAASGGVSDGRVNVGYIQGGIAEGNLFQIFDNIDFGNINIQGDLGKIVAGDQNSLDRAVVNMHVLSHGALGTGTGAPDNVSIFLGGVGRIADDGDWNGTLESVGGDTGDIESLTIKGTLRGDTDPGSGQVFFTGALVNATIGSIVGGAGTSSGTIFGNLTNDSTVTSGSTIGTVHVLGDIVGGAGDDSGRIIAPIIGKVIVDGKLTGGAGAESGVIEGGIASLVGRIGSVLIKGDVVGGTGANSGEIFGASKLGSVVVRGSLLGGTGADSASIVTLGSASAVKVLGIPGTDSTAPVGIVGGTGQLSGSVQITKGLGNFQIGSDAAHSGDLIGGTGDNSGSLSTGAGLSAGIVFGSIEGGTGTFSGGVNVSGTLAKLQIGVDLIGGSSTPASATGGAPDVSTSGFIAANRIGSLVIGRDIVSGTNGGTTLSGSGTIRSTGDIASLVVGRNIVGTEDQPVIIAAEGAGAAQNRTIDTLLVKGNTAYADILGGYGAGVSSDTPLGLPENPDAQMGRIQLNGTVLGTNVAAGVDPGDDGRFGTEDDAVIGGGLADNPAIQSKIAAFIVKGAVTPNTDVFGVVAQVIAAATVGNTRLTLNPALPDDQVLGPALSNFLLHELPQA